MWIWRPKIYVEVFLLLFSGWPSTCEKEKKERKNDDDVENNRRKKKFREINPFFYLRWSMDASSIGIHNRLKFVNLEKSYTITATTSNFFNSPMCPSSFKTFTEFEWERDRFFFVIEGCDDPKVQCGNLRIFSVAPILREISFGNLLILIMWIVIISEFLQFLKFEFY